MRKIFGIPIEGWGMPQAIEHIEKSAKPVWVVTANAEILLAAHRDAQYADVLRMADVRLVDGSGPWFATVCQTERIPGVDFAERLVLLAHDKKWRIGLLGGEAGEASDAAKRIRAAYPGLEVHAEQAGRIERDGAEDATSEEARHRMTLFGPQVLLVAFGHPRQERWIAKHRAEFPELRVVVGVGGTFNFWAGRSKRAPSIMQSAGLEWLWRLIHEPRRWKRIWNAVVVFPVLFVVDRIRPIR